MYVTNKTIDGKQCTITCYVDEIKLSQVDPNMVTDILEEIERNFVDLVIFRGDKHDFLGMNIRISNDKKVELIIKHQIEDTVSQIKDSFDF